MKRFVLLAALSIFLFSFALADEVIKREFETGKGKGLYLNTEVGGDIFVKGWDGDKVIIKAEVIRLDEDEYEIDFNQTANGLRITVERNSRWWKRNGGDMDFSIKVPKEFDIKIETVGGPVTVENIKGDVEGSTSGGGLDFYNIEGKVDFKTMGGSIRAKGIIGRLDLNTMGGSITVTDSKVDGKVKTMGGSIVIEDVDGDLDGSTMGGSVTYRNVTGRSSNSEQDPLIISTMGGSIDVDEAPGGADLTTKGGSISVNKAGKFIKADTQGGSITIREVDGWVNASTMGGSVEVSMVGNPEEGKRDVYITSKGGDIDLTVPPGLSMEFEIELAYTKDSHDDYDIYSDFDLKKERTKNWERSWGSKRKYVYGTGEYSGGKNKIKIATINGDVYIREGKTSN